MYLGNIFEAYKTNAPSDYINEKHTNNGKENDCFLKS